MEPRNAVVLATVVKLIVNKALQRTQLKALSQWFQYALPVRAFVEKAVEAETVPLAAEVRDLEGKLRQEQRERYKLQTDVANLRREAGQSGAKMLSSELASITKRHQQECQELENELTRVRLERDQLKRDVVSRNELSKRDEEVENIHANHRLQRQAMEMEIKSLKSQLKSAADGPQWMQDNFFEEHGRLESEMAALKADHRVEKQALEHEIRSLRDQLNEMNSTSAATDSRANEQVRKMRADMTKIVNEAKTQFEVSYRQSQEALTKCQKRVAELETELVRKKKQLGHQKVVADENLREAEARFKEFATKMGRQRAELQARIQHLEASDSTRAELESKVRELEDRIRGQDAYTDLMVSTVHEVAAI